MAFDPGGLPVPGAGLNHTETVVTYLGRYTRRTAIRDQRILQVNNETVCFRYQDYVDQGGQKVMELPGPEFVRRFLLHVSPKGFQRVSRSHAPAWECIRVQAE